MRKILSTLMLALILITFSFSACTGSGNGGGTSSSDLNSSSSIDSSIPDAEDKVTVEVKDGWQGTEIKINRVDKYNYLGMFKITDNGVNITVQEDFIDKSQVKRKAGTYDVSCTYKDKTAVCSVVVVNVPCEITLKKEEITLFKEYALSYDYIALFSLVVDGRPTAITEDMVTNGVKAEPGIYEYSVTYGDTVKTLKVTVADEHQVNIVTSYKNYNLHCDKKDTFDYTSLFTIFEDDKAIKVTSDMIDVSAVKNGAVNDVCDVVLSYESNGKVYKSTAKVTIVNAVKPVINSKDIETYPNSEFIDLTTLFTITFDGVDVPVTSDMVSGKIDYTTAGVNEITLNYEGQTAVAKVTVVVGVVMGYTKGDTIIIKKGTNKVEYPFEDDFLLMINGIRFYDIAYDIDASNVDFTTTGNYTATLKINYNDKRITSNNFPWQVMTKDITYVVADNTYEMAIKEDVVNLPKGTTKYNVFDNIDLYINDINQNITTNKDWVNELTCYAEVKSPEIDFTKVSPQDVVVWVYVNGVDNEPLEVNFQVICEVGVEITAYDSVVFTNKNAIATEMFNVTENGKPVNVTFDMISGKIDTFNPGVYHIELNYKGIIKGCDVIVIDEKIKGTYKTLNKTFDTRLYVGPDDEGYEADPFISEILDEIVISEEKGEISIRMGEKKIEVVKIVNEHSFDVMIKNNKFNMTIEDGVLVFIPHNELKMKYNNEDRPMVYFAENNWILNKDLIITSTEDHVLRSDSKTMSIDSFRVVNKETNEVKWYSMKITLVSTKSGDWIYEVESGFSQFENNGEIGPIGESFLILNGETYKFEMKGGGGKIIKEQIINPFGFLNLKGTVNGKEAFLTVTESQLTYMVDGNVVASVLISDVPSMVNGGFDKETNTIMVYKADIRTNTAFAYKFIIDKLNGTFQFVEPDMLTGLYHNGDQIIFIDGYGHGYINFNTKHYYITNFDYVNTSNILELNFKDSSAESEYGNKGYLHIDEFLNIVTAHGFKGGIKEGTSFENINILSGAIVNIDNYVIGIGINQSETKEGFLRGIHITTKDGEIAVEDLLDRKQKYVDTSTVHFGKPGYYQFTITLDVFGTPVTKKYSLCLLEKKLEGSSFAKTFGQGVFYPTNSVMVDEYGRMKVTLGSEIYKGSVVVVDGNSFRSTLHSDEGHTISASAKLIQEGTLLIDFSGDVVFSDYYSVNEKGVAGTNGMVIRYFKSVTDPLFIVAASANDPGVITTVKAVKGDLFSAGSILNVISENGTETYVTVNDWNNVKTGLVIEDGVRGEYTNANGDKLILDGFGKVQYKGIFGTYKKSSRGKLDLTIKSEHYGVQIDKENNTFVDLDFKFDDSMVIGKVFTAEYNFICHDTEDNALYKATTTFSFLKDGRVVVLSESPEHDDLENGCMSGKYSPLFTTTSDKLGSYTISGTTITVIVNNYTIIFNIEDAFTVSKIVCESSTIPSSSHGYFTKGTAFYL